MPKAFASVCGLGHIQTSPDRHPILHNFTSLYRGYCSVPLVRKSLQNVFCTVFSEANTMFSADGKTSSRLAEELAYLLKFLKCITVIAAFFLCIFRCATEHPFSS